MLFCVLNDLFGHYLPFETAERAFNRFALINCNNCHSVYMFLLSGSFATTLFNTGTTMMVKLRGPKCQKIQPPMNADKRGWEKTGTAGEQSQVAPCFRPIAFSYPRLSAFICG